MNREYGEIRQAFVYDPSLVLYLPLYELDKASFMSKDAYGHPGTVTGAVWRPNGRYFDGVDDWVDCGTSVALQPVAWTFEFWYKHVAGDWKRIFVMSGTEYPYFVVSPLELDMSSSNWRNWNQAPVNVLDENWHHIAVCIPGSGVNDISSAKCFADGQEQQVGGTSQAGTQTAKTRLWLGRRATGAGWLNGFLGEVRFYSRVLTPLEIQQNYLATKWRYR